MFDYYILGIILIPAILLASIAQVKVNSTYSAYKKVVAKSGKTAAEVARLLLDAANLQHVKVIRVNGHLTDYYDPKRKVVALSASVYDSASVAAIGIAAHEVGHAVQYKENYIPVKLRSALIPVTNFANVTLWPLVFIGLVLGFTVSFDSALSLLFVWSGVIIFSLAALLNIITLPVEYNASNRAVKVLYKTEILTAGETAGAKKVLSAAALTYVAAMLIAVLNLVRFLLVIANRRN